jgi:hypothetical protein
LGKLCTFNIGVQDRLQIQKLGSKDITDRENAELFWMVILDLLAFDKWIFYLATWQIMTVYNMKQKSTFNDFLFHVCIFTVVEVSQ